eukprot:3073946-Prymnesium_polylepis.1
MSATLPDAIPALLTIANSGGGVRPWSASSCAAAARTLPSEDVSISTTISRSFHSGRAATSAAAASSPRDALRHARTTCVSPWSARQRWTIARPMPRFACEVFPCGRSHARHCTRGSARGRSARGCERGFERPSAHA